jgi:hypothetical protein
MSLMLPGVEQAVAAAILRGIERGRFRDRAGSVDGGAGAFAQRGSLLFCTVSGSIR